MHVYEETCILLLMYHTINEQTNTWSVGWAIKQMGGCEQTLLRESENESRLFLLLLP